MDRSIWIRIAATGGPAAAAELRTVGRAVREAGAQARIGANMVRTSASVMSTSIARSFGGIPNKLGQVTRSVSTAARSLSASMGRAMAAGGFVSPKVTGASQFTQGMRQMGMSARVGTGLIAATMRDAGVVVKQGFSQMAMSARTGGSLIASSVADTGRAAVRTWKTATMTIATNVRGMSSIVGDHITRTTGSLRVMENTLNRVGNSRIFKLGDENAQAAHSLGIAFAAVGAVIGGVFAVSIAQAARFQTQMQNVNSVLQTTPRQLGLLAEQVKALSTILPQSPTQLAAGLYEVAQAGFEGQKAFVVLKAAATAASAGLTDTVTAATGLMAVLNAYGISVAKADYISDVLFQTVKVGIITFQELSQQIGDFVGFAAAAGIRIEDLGIAMATMTRAGIPAAEAATSLNRVIQALVKPSRDMQAAMKDLGFNVDDFRHKNLRLGDVFVKLQKYTGGNVVAIQKLFREIRAARGAYAMMADGGHLLATVTRQFGNEGKITGQTLKALSQQSQALNFQWEITKNQFAVAAIDIGTKFLPVLTDLVKTLASVVGAWSDLPGPIQNAVLILGGVVGAFTILAGLTFLIIPRLASVSAGFSAMGISAGRAAIAVRVLSISVGAVGGILAAATIAWALYSALSKDAKVNTEALTEAIRVSGDTLSETVQIALSKQMGDEGITTAFNNIGISAGLAIDSIQGIDGAAEKLARQIDRVARKTDAWDKGNLHTTKYFDGLTRAIKNGNLGALGGYIKQLELARSVAKDLNDSGSNEDEKQTFNDIIKGLSFVGQSRHDALLSMQAYQEATKATTESTIGARNAMISQGTAMAQLKEQGNKLTDMQKAYNAVVAAVVSPGAAYKDALDALKPLTTLTGTYTELLAKQQKELDEHAKSQSKAQNASLKAAGDGVTDAAAKRRNAISASAAADRAAISAAAAAMRAVTKSTGSQMSAQARAGVSARAAAARADLAASTRDQKRALSAQRTAASDFKQVAKVSLREYISALQSNADKSQVYYGDLTKITERGFGDLANAVGDGSDASVTLAALFAVATDKELKKVQKSYEGLAPSAKTSFNKFLSELQARHAAFEKLNSNMFKLVARGQGDLVKLIMESSFDPQQQAALMNSAAQRGKKGLDKLYDELLFAADKGSGVFGIVAEQNVAVVQDVVARADQLGKAANFEELYANYAKLAGKTAVTKEDFIMALTSMGGAIKDLPTNVKTVVTAYVNGAEKLDNLNKKLRDFTALAGAGKTGMSIRGIEHKEASLRAAIEVEANMQITSMSASGMAINANSVVINASSKNIHSGPAHPAHRTEDGMVYKRFEQGGMLPKQGIIQPVKRQLIQWAEPSTGGEAFIPLARSKRARSLAIMNEVAEMFGYSMSPKGMAAGGVTRSAKPVVVVAAPGSPGLGNTTEHRTHSQPIYVDKVVAHDYDDFRKKLDRESSYRSMPGHPGGR